MFHRTHQSVRQNQRPNPVHKFGEQRYDLALLLAKCYTRTFHSQSILSRSLLAICVDDVVHPNRLSVKNYGTIWKQMTCFLCNLSRVTIILVSNCEVELVWLEIL